MVGAALLEADDEAAEDDEEATDDDDDLLAEADADDELLEATDDDELLEGGVVGLGAAVGGTAVGGGAVGAGVGAGAHAARTSNTSKPIQITRNIFDILFFSFSFFLSHHCDHSHSLE